MKELEIIIEEDGSVSIEAIGYHGKGCAADTDAFAKALGKKVKSSKKCEYYQPEVKTENKQRIQQR